MFHASTQRARCPHTSLPGSHRSPDPFLHVLLSGEMEILLTPEAILVDV